MFASGTVQWYLKIEMTSNNWTDNLRFKYDEAQYPAALGSYCSRQCTSATFNEREDLGVFLIAPAGRVERLSSSVVTGYVRFDAPAYK